MKLLMKAIVRDVRMEAVAVKSFDLVPAKRASFEPFTAGAHVTVQLPNGVKRPYSLASDSADPSHYRLAVLRETQGRGGSIAMHALKAGDTLFVSHPHNRFPLASNAVRHVFIAGGIGITPFLPMMAEARRTGTPFELHYCARSALQAAFVGELECAYRPALRLYFDGGNPQRGLDVLALLAAPQEGTHVYCCGPAALMAAVRAAAAHWRSENIHFEAFAGVPEGERVVGEPFELVIRSTGHVLRVPPGRSALEVLNAQGFKINACCESGACGACKIRYRAGEPVHRDFALSPKERLNHFIPCVSRANGRLTLDL